MAAGTNRIQDYLGHMADALSRIQRYTTGMDQAGFDADTLVQDAVIRNLEIIGEASRNITRDDPAFATAHPELPLAAAYEMRNALAHGYFQVDLAIVWQTLKQDLPALATQVQHLLASSAEPPDAGPT